MKKRLISLALAAALALTMVGCRGNDEPAASTPAASAPAASEPSSSGDTVEPYKIGIITGTAAQNDEAITQANKMKEKYPGVVVTATYPDNFATETETLISVFTSMASDPEVKAIVVCQSVPGTSAAIDKVRETRPDILFIAGGTSEDPNVIEAKADIVLGTDTPGIGLTYPVQAKELGAKTIVHYSFPRHMSSPMLVQRRENMKAVCEELGILFVDETAPDPTGDSGVTGAQQFIIEDVPRKIAEYGPDTAFYATNCSMQEPLIRGVIEGKAIYPLQCCPSPFHAIPSAMNLDMTGHEADVDYLAEQVSAYLEPLGMNGRISTWAMPQGMVYIAGGVDYCIEYLEGRTNGRQDYAALEQCMQNIAMENWGATLTVGKYTVDGVEHENHVVTTASYITF